jgi:hypothetical protein
VDDFGRFHADPAVILGRCFSLMTDRVKLKHVLRGRNELATLGLIILYRSGDDEILQIYKFNQRVRAKESKFQPPNDRHVTVIRPSDDGLESLVVPRIENRESKTDDPPDGGQVSVIDDFERFWEAYPRKVGKGAARRIWDRIKPDGRLAAAMLRTLEWQTASEQWTKDNGQYVPHPSTWLNQRRWEDQPIGSSPEPESPEVEAVFRRIREGRTDG